MSILEKAKNQVESLASNLADNIVNGVRTVNRPSTEIKIEDLLEEGTRLQYPLHDVNRHNMYVTFNTLTQVNADLNKSVKSAGKKNSSFLQDVIELAPSRKENAQNIGGGIDAEPLSVTPPLSQAPKAKRQPLISGREVRLYIPAQLQFTDGMQYNTMSLGAIGGAAEAAIQSGQDVNLASASMSAIGEGIGSLIDGITTTLDTDLGAVAAQRAARKSPVAADKLAGAISSATQTTMNPNNRTLFEGVATRTFAFNFTLIAESVQEAVIIEQMIKHFRAEMYPSEILAVKGDGFQIPVGYNFPKKWKIRFWDNDSGQQVFHQIRPAFLTNMTTTYNSGESTFHEDGRPTSVEISMTFMEDRPLARKDVMGGY